MRHAGFIGIFIRAPCSYPNIERDDWGGMIFDQDDFEAVIESGTHEILRLAGAGQEIGAANPKHNGDENKEKTFHRAHRIGAVDRLTSTDDLGLYLHAPFCAHICPYCDFAVEAVGRGTPKLADAWVSNLLQELDLVLAEVGPALLERSLVTLYLGGGTPSLLPIDALERLFRQLHMHWPQPIGEVTLEVNPGLGELDHLAEWRALGVTRVSLGVQSFHDILLKRLGRGHSGAAAEAGLRKCLSAGFESVSVDLIFGVPDQTLAMLNQDLNLMLELAVPHISAYALTLEVGTPFTIAHAKGKLKLPAEDDLIAMHDLVEDRLHEAGYEQYEISSFSLTGHRSRHNQRYWARQDVLGLGPSASSLLNAERTTNFRARQAWEAALHSKQRPVEERERLGAMDLRRETLYLGFRRPEGIDLRAYEARFGEAVESCFETEVNELKALGLLQQVDRHLSLTRRGVRFADEVFLRFVGR